MWLIVALLFFLVVTALLALSLRPRVMPKRKEWMGEIVHLKEKKDNVIDLDGARLIHMLKKVSKK